MRAESEGCLVEAWADAEAWFAVMDGGDEGYAFIADIPQKVDADGVD